MFLYVVVYIVKICKSDLRKRFCPLGLPKGAAMNYFEFVTRNNEKRETNRIKTVNKEINLNLR